MFKTVQNIFMAKDLGFRGGGHHSPLVYGGSRLSPSAPGSGRRREKKPRPARVGRFREGGPSCLRVRESCRRASPALSERLRPAWAGTSPAAPRPESTRCNAASTAVAAPAGTADVSAAAELSAAPTNRCRGPTPLRPARLRPRARGPTPHDSSAADERRARIHLPRPLQPA